MIFRFLVKFSWTKVHCWKINIKLLRDCKSNQTNRYSNYTFQNNVNYNLEKTVGYNNKILTKIGTNRNISKAEIYHQKSRLAAAPSEPYATPEMHLMKSLDKPIKKIILETGIKIYLLAKYTITLFIVGTGLITYHIW